LRSIDKLAGWTATSKDQFKSLSAEHNPELYSKDFDRIRFENKEHDGLSDFHYGLCSADPRSRPTIVESLWTF
jgi:hypothetical protein